MTAIRPAGTQYSFGPLKEPKGFWKIPENSQEKGTNVFDPDALWP